MSLDLFYSAEKVCPPSATRQTQYRCIFPTIPWCHFNYAQKVSSQSLSTWMSDLLFGYKFHSQVTKIVTSIMSFLLFNLHWLALLNGWARDWCLKRTWWMKLIKLLKFHIQNTTLCDCMCFFMTLFVKNLYLIAYKVDNEII